MVPELAPDDGLTSLLAIQLQNVQRLDRQTMWLLGGVLVLLAILSVVGRLLRKQPEGTVNPALARMFNQRIRSWWLMFSILIFGFILHRTATVVLLGLVSFWALREFITMTPTRRGDHRTLFWVFIVITPAQYVLVGLGNEFYAFYSIMIPVYASLFIPARIAISGDHRRFLERSAKIQAGLLICVYSLSYAAALLDEPLFQSVGGTRVEWTGSHEGLLFYFVLIVQLGDVFQYSWGRILGRHVIAPEINASRTWEGLIGGVATSTIFGVLLHWVTPFGWWGSAFLSMIIAGMGFAGGMTMSAIKRDRGVTDYGTLVQGHAGVLDRIDSVCFAAPVFFHLAPFFAALN